MAWRDQRARKRIKEAIGRVPEIDVRKFSDEYLPIYEKRKLQLEAVKERVSPPLFDLARGSAVLVNTVQIYIGITNYDEYRLEDGSETVKSHEHALRFLHLYYSACDRVVEKSGAQRVDFHGGRMHAVVLDRVGEGVTPANILEALAFIRDFQAVADRANRELANSDFTARFRIGIDIGQCVAINNGTGLEQEPMFLGSAANHAAKLAQGDQPGLFVSDRVRSLMGMPELGALEGTLGFDDTTIESLIAQHLDHLGAPFDPLTRSEEREFLMEEWKGDIQKMDVPDPKIPRFTFHHQEPPLSGIDYSELAPSNSIRMPLVSIFADLCGYTAYVDTAIANGKIADIVRALYVIRDEFQCVVEDDFGGRKVRFIGDCVHALIAEGSKIETDEKKSVTQSLSCAGGLRSSFRLCQEELNGLGSLGLAIGLEFGSTPVTRLGIRGERSVRLASSVSTTVSEQMQRECGDRDTKLGPKAKSILPIAYQDLVDDSGIASALTYDDVVTSSSGAEISVAAPAYARAHTPTTNDVPRAHATKE